MREPSGVQELKRECGVKPYTDKTLASSRRRYLQLALALLARDLVELIPIEEVREEVGVFLVEKKGKVTHRFIIDVRLSNLHDFVAGCRASHL